MGTVGVVGTVSTVEKSGSSFSPQPAAPISAATAASAAAVRAPALRFLIRLNVSDRDRCAFSAFARAGIRRYMDTRMKLGFHRLGRPFEDGVNLGIGLIVAWAVVVWTIAIAGALGFTTMLLLILAGAAVVVLLRNPVAALARSWRRGRLELERRYTGPAAS